MAFRVEISPRALEDLDEIATYIERNSSFEQAEKWFSSIFAAIRTLEKMPHRCPIADEAEELGREVRVLVYGRPRRGYKVYYSVQQRTPSTGVIRVFHVRHWARSSVKSSQLRELMAEPGT